MRLPSKLPPSLYQFFWDVDAKKVNPGESTTYVVHRLLDKGNLEAARWVIKRFPRETIVETLKKMRDFSPWNAVFWGRLFNIKREEMKCLDPHYLKLRKQLWPY